MRKILINIYVFKILLITIVVIWNLIGFRNVVDVKNNAPEFFHDHNFISYFYIKTKSNLIYGGVIEYQAKYMLGNDNIHIISLGIVDDEIIIVDYEKITNQSINETLFKNLN